MSKLETELSKKLEKLSNVFFFAQDVYLYTEYFHNPETKEELELVINSPLSYELGKIMHFMFRTLVIEVSKLYSNKANDKFRIETLIESLSPSGHFGKLDFSDIKINRWKNELAKLKSKAVDVNTLRDKLYAHTDNPLHDYSNLDISFKQIKQLLDFVAEVLKEIYWDLFGGELDTNSPSFSRKHFPILKILLQGENQRQDEIFARALNKKQI